MPTENPKISAYVPQVVYDRFREYQQERGLSMSQAAIEIFAHYFGLNLGESAKEFTGGLPGKLLSLEESLQQLKDLYDELSIKVDDIKSTGELPRSNIINGSISETQDSIPLSEPDGSSSAKAENGSKDNLLSELLVDSTEPSNLQMELIDTSNELPSSLPFDQATSTTLSASQGKPIKISHQVLAKRLGVAEGTLMNKKAKSNEEFAQWSASKDPDGIGWKSVKENRKVDYIPVGSLDSELHNRLLGLVEK